MRKPHAEKNSIIPIILKNTDTVVKKVVVAVVGQDGVRLMVSALLGATNSISKTVSEKLIQYEVKSILPCG